ncbi:hypothetical protein CMU10_06875 [Elizabethkingia anophelis]|uniref:phosphoribosyltransferase-like protein n=1 Tax=Elizabethkingia anophelis TaxID=1117645 RepID=UPI0021A4F7DC|nr:hypothetical protein [Elizabethkingia anophelis]MCT4057278.1 hypothetical protein [Elizabethkingia anophelis]MCT4067835.1 hypothetical protein [Elizabethkingia anophelis]MCT4119110.1 hypothetical protein [Elizabethkingia anophelis]MCT4219024.1 hypothetical protein [Elizabethkingia anophelis]
MTPKQVLDLDKILTQKGWNQNPLHDSMKNKLFTLLSKLDNDEINLILELLHNFTWISNSQYDKKILDVFRKIDPNIIRSCKKLYFFPIVKPRDSSKLKSGIALIYPIVGILNYLEDFDHINKGNILNTYKQLKNLKLKKDEYLILVDDFIGSGKTFEDCFNQIQCYGIPKDKLIVCTLAIQKEGLELIKNLEVTSYYSHIEKKGITNYNIEDEAIIKIQRMTLIEKKMKYNSKYSLGFEKSEGLISLIKTPNNTFPIFWHEYTEAEKIMKAPFPRY